MKIQVLETRQNALSEIKKLLDEAYERIVSARKLAELHNLGSIQFRTAKVEHKISLLTGASENLTKKYQREVAFLEKKNAD